MNKKIQLRKALKRAKLDLIRHKVIDSPTYYIKSKNPNIPLIVIGPGWHSQEAEETRAEETRIRQIREICQKINVSNVLLVMNTYVYLGDGDIPTSEALSASIEDGNGIHIVLLPYQMRTDRPLIFGKEIWYTLNKDEYTGTLGGLVG